MFGSDYISKGTFKIRGFPPLKCGVKLPISGSLPLYVKVIIIIIIKFISDKSP